MSTLRKTQKHAKHKSGIRRQIYYKFNQREKYTCLMEPKIRDACIKNLREFFDTNISENPNSAEAALFKYERDVTEGTVAAMRKVYGIDGDANVINLDEEREKRHS